MGKEDIKFKTWALKKLPKLKEKYPVDVIDRKTGNKLDTSRTHGLTDFDRGYNAGIKACREALRS